MSTDNLVAALRSRINELACDLLGEPNRAFSSKRELRFGSKGALCIWIAGHRRGGWADFSSDAKGNPLGLIRYARRCDWPAAEAWARSWLGHPEENQGADTRATAEGSLPQRSSDADRWPDRTADAERRSANARRLWQEAAPAAATLAERYLVEQRKIPIPLQGWPAAIRFHRGTCSLIVAATTEGGTVRAVQMVRLTLSGQVAKRSDGSKIKLSRGSLAGVAVRLPGPIDGPLLLAEGPETGLSVWRSTGSETWIALGSMARMTPPMRRPVVVCADDDPLTHPDPRKVAAAQALAQAVRAWRSAGAWLVVATPNAARRQDKSDFNDLLRARGLSAVRGRINEALAELAAERRRHVAEHAIPRAIRDLLTAHRKSSEIFAAARHANAEQGDVLPDAEVLGVCTRERIRQERLDWRLWRGRRTS
jgi:phage/plasmid primase-like uncharacterized protein